jgi:hypothetical protein
VPADSRLRKGRLVQPDVMTPAFRVFTAESPK